MKSKTLKRALAGLLSLLCVVSAFSAGIINTAAGASAKIGISNDDGTYKTLTILYNSDNTYTITYNTALSW